MSTSRVTDPISFHDDFIGEQGDAFETAAQGLKQKLDEALTNLAGDASSPTYLAAYQAAFSSYTVFRNAQTNTIKVWKEIDTTIIRAASS
ncbi:hypothetical protein PS865_04445 [Pseudomonas fluorescens]|uniref:EscF/YscF/HrpA family type III secretion system needle major subunit n=1 Tax=Pseudomonas fluorescens TaxID=294 RepID=UPI00123FF0F1|nr:EscF/YscF/HrpA family type III secretion system needle major subunit [Pseudomonas fluorescens]VVP32692.1 hypothetical protein PS865_04445 [Pseudomonas fluorescens]